MANGMFERQLPNIKEELATPEFLRHRQQLGGMAEELADVTAPFIKEVTGYESPKRQMQRMAAETDLSDGKAVQATYNEILKKSPEAANQWLQSVMPVLKQNIEQQKIQASRAGTVDADKAARAHRYNELVAQHGKSEGTKQYLAERAAAKVQMTGTIPQGYRMTAQGQLEPIPGGPAAAEAKGVQEAAEARKVLAKRGITVVKGKIGDAFKLIEGTKGDTADPLFSVTGAAASYIPGTQRKDMENIVETIKANIGFDKLQQMREASPTGGALGQVAVQELVALQASLGSLSLDQSREEFARSLKSIENHYNNMLQIIDGKMPKGAQQQNLNPLGI